MLLHFNTKKVNLIVKECNIYYELRKNSYIR